MNLREWVERYGEIPVSDGKGGVPLGFARTVRSKMRRGLVDLGKHPLLIAMLAGSWFALGIVLGARLP